MFEFRKTVLEDLGYDISQCKCDTFACMVFESVQGDYTITTIFYKDNIFLKRQIITQQHILLTENTEEIIDMKNLATYHPMYNKEITEFTKDVSYHHPYSTLCNMFSQTVEMMKARVKKDPDEIDTLIRTTVTREGLSSETLTKALIELNKMIQEVNHHDCCNVNKNIIEDIFGQDDYDVIANYLNIERSTFIESLKSNFDGAIEIVNNVLNGPRLAKIHKVKLQNALDNLMVISLNH